MKTRILFLILSVLLNIGGWFLGGWVLHLLPSDAWYVPPTFFCCMTFWLFNLIFVIVCVLFIFDYFEGEIKK